MVNILNEIENQGRAATWGQYEKWKVEKGIEDKMIEVKSNVPAKGDFSKINIGTADTYANLFNAFKQKAIQENIILDHEDLCFLFKTDPGYINQIYYKNNADKIVLESLEELIEIVKKYANP
jgi:hypothetical protein